MLRTIRSMLSDRGQAVLYECRRCGRSLDAETTACPSCGSTEIATIRL